MFILNPYTNTSSANTIIGGAGSVITTKSALATKLGISESIIQGFKIVGSDVHCKITDTYHLPHEVFVNDTTISSYHDYGGKVLGYLGGAVTRTHQFAGSSIKEATFNGLAQTYSYMFDGSEIEQISTPNATKYSSYTLRSTPIISVDSPLLANLSDAEVMYNTPNMAIVNFKPAIIGFQSMRNCGGTPDLSELTQITGAHGLRQTKYTEMYMPNLTTVGSTFCTDSSLVTKIEADKLESIANVNNLFNGLSSCVEISMKMLKTYGSQASGGGTANSYGLNTLKTGCTFKVNIALATANSGNPHEAFVWAKNNRSAIVEFYDDSGNYVSTL